MVVTDKELLRVHPALQKSVTAVSPAASPSPPHVTTLGSAVEFAVGIAALGSFAKVYGADNATLGFQAIARAVAMADTGIEGVVAYTVLPDADVGPDIDIDLPRGLDQVTQSTLKEIVARAGRVHAALDGHELQAALQGFEASISVQLWMLEQLRDLYHRVTAEPGTSAAILASGRGAHLLILGLAPADRQALLGRVAWLQDELRLKLTAAGLPDTEAAFEVKRYCRPPGSPHRLEGDLGILLYPLPGLDAGPQRDLLDRLAERGRQRIAQGLLAQTFPPRLNELLREGRLVGARLDLFLRVAVRHGLELTHAQQVLEPQGYRAKAPGPGWYRRLAGWWRKAQAAATKIDCELAPIRAAVEADDWRYRGGATDRRGLLAYIKIAVEEARLTVSPGDRRVAEEAGLKGARSVSPVNQRLRDRGWLRRSGTARRWGRKSAVYTLQLPRSFPVPVSPHPYPLAPSPLPARSTPLGGESEQFLSQSPSHAVWMMLPAGSPAVWGVLTNIQATARSIATAAGLSLRQVQRSLVALAPAGLASSGRGTARGGRPPIYWVKGPATLDEAACTLGVEANRKALKERHARDRERLLEARMGPQPRLPSLAETPCSSRRSINA
jgi:hypothetical protein